MSDTNSNLLAQALCDKIDEFLVKQGFAFRESESWENYVEQLIALMYHFYDDHGEDSDFVPSSTTETTTASVSLHTTDEDDDDMSVDD